jgi:lipid II:glycine glycyltransferase (peptidoglycan interpeptide bridge formation enzyme)
LLTFKIVDSLNVEEQKLWGRFIEEIPCSHFFQKYEWGEFLKRYAAVEVRYLLGEEDASLKIAGMMMRKRAPHSQRGLFEIPCGPVFSDPLIFCRAVKFLDDYMKTHGISLQVNPRWPIQTADKVRDVLVNNRYSEVNDPLQLGYHSKSVQVDLRPSLTEILGTFRKTTRHAIRDEEALGVEVQFFNNQGGVDLFYDLYEKLLLERSLGWVSRDRRSGEDKGFFDLIRSEILGEARNGFFAIAKKNGHPLSGGLFFINGKGAWYTYGASDPAMRRELSSSHLLLWRAMQYSKNLGCDFFDLGGAQNVEPSNSLYGVMVFKMGFSKMSVEFLPRYVRVYKPSLMWLFKLRRLIHDWSGQVLPGRRARLSEHRISLSANSRQEA